MTNGEINTLLSLLSMTLVDKHPKGFDEAKEYCIKKAKELNAPDEVLQHLNGILSAIHTSLFETLIARGLY